MEMKNRMMDHMIPDDALDAVAGGTSDGAQKSAKFDIGDWVCYVSNTSIVGQITQRQYNKTSNSWEYKGKYMGQGAEYGWFDESLMKAASAPA